MKKLLIILLIVILQFQYISQLAVLVSFILNREVIAQLWCEKKNEENNTCNGKCYLKKQLKKAEAPEETQKNKFPAYKFKFDFEYNHESKPVTTHHLHTVELTLSGNKQCKVLKGYLLSLTKPPTI